MEIIDEYKVALCSGVDEVEGNPWGRNIGIFSLAFHFEKINDDYSDEKMELITSFKEDKM